MAIAHNICAAEACSNCTAVSGKARCDTLSPRTATAEASQTRKKLELRNRLDSGKPSFASQAVTLPLLSILHSLAIMLPFCCVER